MICDKDCFHCKFNDCINDEIEPEVIDEKTLRKRKNVAEYYRTHKEKCLARSKRWREAHRERANEINRRWRERQRIEKSNGDQV